MEDFRIEDYPSIKRCLEHYYQISGKEKETGKPMKDWLYKAKELFRNQGDGSISSWHLDTIEEYFGVPAYDHLLMYQDNYLHYGCKRICSKGSLRSYLKTTHLRNNAVKFHVDNFRTMIGAMV